MSSIVAVKDVLKLTVGLEVKFIPQGAVIWFYVHIAFFVFVWCFAKRSRFDASWRAVQ